MKKICGVDSNNMLRVILVLFVLFVCNTSFSQSNSNEIKRVEYPYLADVIDEYYFHYFSIPCNLSEVIQYAKELRHKHSEYLPYYEILHEYTFPKLLSDDKDIRFVETDCGFNMFVNNELVYHNTDSPCCDSTNSYREEERGLILRRKVNRVRFLMEKGTLTDMESLRHEFISLKKNIDMNYTFSNNEIYFFVFDEKIKSYCGNIELNNSYFIELEREITLMANKNNIKKIFFYTFLPIDIINTSPT